MRVVFMGNPEFAIPTLKAIRHSNHDLIAVVSNPRKPIGRGRTLQLTSVGKFAKENGINLLEPESLTCNNFRLQLEQLRPDIFVIVAYKILPKSIIELPVYGAINLHASLLPKYRGAGPVQWALINGDKKTGVTIFQITKKVDAGDILMQKIMNVYEDDNMLSLGMRLCEQGSKMIIKTIDKIEIGTIKKIQQDSTLATPAPKITKKMTLIDWNWENMKIHNWVRGLSPYPGMSTIYKKKRLRIYKTCIVKGDSAIPGSIISCDNELIISTGKGLISLLEIQIEGKRKMQVNEFLRGFIVELGDVLGA